MRDLQTSLSQGYLSVPGDGGPSQGAAGSWETPPLTGVLWGMSLPCTVGVHREAIRLRLVSGLVFYSSQCPWQKGHKVASPSDSAGAGPKALLLRREQHSCRTCGSLGLRGLVACVCFFVV